MRHIIYLFVTSMALATAGCTAGEPKLGPSADPAMQGAQTKKGPKAKKKWAGGPRKSGSGRVAAAGANADQPAEQPRVSDRAPVKAEHAAQHPLLKQIAPISDSAPSLNDETPNFALIQEHYLRATPKNMVVLGTEISIKRFHFERDTWPAEGTGKEVQKGQFAGVLFDGPNLEVVEVGTRFVAPAGTPLLVWSINGASSPNGTPQIVGVTPEGWVLNVDITDVKAFDPEAAWPPRPERTHSSLRMFQQAVDHKLMPESAIKGTHTAIEQGDKCTDQVWAPYKRQLEALEVADLHYQTRENRKEAVTDQGIEAVQRSCAHYGLALADAEKKALQVWRAEEDKLSKAVREHFKK